jgi:hypothetical protein
MPAFSAWGTEPGASVSDAHGGGPWVGGVMRWQFARANAHPHAVNDARWRRSKTPAEWSVAEAASHNGRGG